MIDNESRLYLIEKDSVSVKEAAMLMGKSEQFIRIGLQRDRLPFGTAVKMSTQWCYYISPKLFYNYIGYKEVSRSA